MPVEANVLALREHQGDGSTTDAVIAALATAGHGVVSRSELVGAGLTPAEIRGRVDRGSLLPLHRGVYAVGHRVLTRRGRWRAAVLAAGPGAVLSHRPAARMRSIGSEGPVIDVTVPARRRGCAGVRVWESSLASDEIVVVDGIPVTTTARTLIDLAAVLPRRGLERAVRQAEILRLADATSLPDLLARHRGRRGLATLRAVLRETDVVSITRSELEEMFLAFSRRRRLPRPSTNATALGYEVDLVWREQRVAGELDGFETHGTRSAFERDRERDRKLLVAGWRVVRITYRQLRFRPDELEADLRRLLEANVVAL